MPPDAEQVAPFAIPRPGFATALGIVNITFATIMALALLGAVAWVVGVARTSRAAEGLGPRKTTDIKPSVASFTVAFDLTMGMNEPGFIRFAIVDIATALTANALMLASGIGLVNLRRWGASLWTWTAWIKIGRLVLLWTVFVVAVAPALSENLARTVLEMLRSQQTPAARMPSMGDLTRVYSILNLILAVGMIVLGSIYPAASLWILRKPGLGAALAPSGRPSLGA